MKYDEYLAKVLKDDCPFCNLKEEYLLEKGKYFSVIMARATLYSRSSSYCSQ